ncbi:MAG: endonuclease [Peptococcaceae bacterium]|jgi:5-methylcytosine-specific restriction protein A|nr:endonuclease [Peptococcaceae bacterium]
MPTKPKRPCSWPGCRELISEGRYCDKHRFKEQQQRAESSKYYDKFIRDEKVTMFYKSKAWNRARQQALIRDHYLCQECLKEKQLTRAETVHHKVPIKDDWSLRLVLSNLVSLCSSCHNKIHSH